MAGQKTFLYNPGLPRVLNISFNEKTCFFRCRMCRYSVPKVRQMYRRGSEMDKGTLRNIVKSVPNDPFFSFDMSSIGETLEFEALPEFVAFMKAEKPLVNTIVSTNAMLLNKELSVALIESGLDSLQLSLFAENAEDHRFISGTRSFERVRENIIHFGEIRKRMGKRKPFTQVFMLLTKETEAKAESFRQFWSQHVDAAFIRPLSLRDMDIEGLEATYDIDEMARYPCIGPWYSTAIRSNGDVLCCYSFHWHEETKDAMVAGNINESTLAEIWRGEKMTSIREAHLAQDFSKHPHCNRCRNWDNYTDVWFRQKERFEYSPVRFQDFFKAPPPYRGG